MKAAGLLRSLTTSSIVHGSPAPALATSPAPSFSFDKKARKKYKREQKKKLKKAFVGSNSSVLFKEVEDLIGNDKTKALKEQGNDFIQKFEPKHKLTLTIDRLTSTGDGLGLTAEKDWAVVVPFTLPGEIITASIYKNDQLHSFGDLEKVIRASPDRKSENIRCKYFGKCAGCQYQELNYGDQLNIKRTVVGNAYKYFGGKHDYPTVMDTIASPLEYGYRTKLTPHFDVPNPQNIIGFNKVGRKERLDIEQCALATPTINQKLLTERERYKREMDKFKLGSTLLLRHSLSKENEDPICITNHSETAREKIGNKIFEFNAGSFFQNNSSILERLADHVKKEIMGARKHTEQEHNLVDTYCGSGYFAIMLSDIFNKVAGIEISKEAIKSATNNAKLNNIKNCTFVDGDAQNIFKMIKFDPKNTTVLIDPSRKGCDQQFLDQLLAFRPSTIVYVSCNVHTQARDINNFLVSSGKDSYSVKSIRGADLFPQSYHVESIAVLTLNDE